MNNCSINSDIYMFAGTSVDFCFHVKIRGELPMDATGVSTTFSFSNYSDLYMSPIFETPGVVNINTADNTISTVTASLLPADTANLLTGKYVYKLSITDRDGGIDIPSHGFLFIMNTTYFKNLLAGNIFGTATTPKIPAKYFLGLSSTELQTDGTGAVEVPTDGTAYTRVEITSLSAPNSGVVKNASAISFPRSLLDWGTLTHYVICDAVTGGNYLCGGALTKSRIVQSDSILSIEPNGITISVS